ncbi:response regulator [Endozoicomonas sp.]|uniref:response regulator n=1 Tax=Endozoicomonas sp. TaxID=1892382 RepID=UPI002887AB39|nr:response regulator [Endozoicomonas sp.]
MNPFADRLCRNIAGRTIWMNTATLKNILYIEDDKDIRALVTLSLQALSGYQVDTFDSGVEFLDKGKAMQPQLVLLDVMMPEVDGPAVFREMQKIPHYKNTPVIFMTARVQTSEVEEYKNMGAAGVIAKPFDPVQLTEMIASIWGDFQNNKGDQYSNHLDQLRKNYLDNIESVIQDIHRYLFTLEEGSFNRNDLSQLKMTVCNLLGSGQSFGFQDLTKSAEILVHSLDDIQDDGTAIVLSGYDESRLSALMLAFITVIEKTRDGYTEVSSLTGSSSFVAGQNTASGK